MVTGIMRTLQSGRSALHLAGRRQHSSPTLIAASKGAELVTTSLLPSIARGNLQSNEGSSMGKYYHNRQSSSSSTGRYDEESSRSSEPYVSPFQDIFARMEVDGPNLLGTTQEILDIEKAYEMNQKKLECGIPERVLRFSSTAYGRTLLAPTVHVNEHRVIMKMNTKHLPFTTSNEYEILREIVGDRLNDQRNELRLTSNKFGSRIENKRHLVSMLDRILLSCQKLGAELKDDAATKDDAERKDESETA